MTKDESKRIDMSIFGPWLSDVQNRWTVLGRSWEVFALNAAELIQHLRSAMTDHAVSIQLMMDHRGDLQRAYWAR